jgi:hypothetical protein
MAWHPSQDLSESNELDQKMSGHLLSAAGYLLL